LQNIACFKVFNGMQANIRKGWFMMIADLIYTHDRRIGFRLAIISLIFGIAVPPTARGQSTYVKEYIYLNGRVIVIENSSNGVVTPTVNITNPTAGQTYTTTIGTISLAGDASMGVVQVTWASDRGGYGSCAGTTSWTCSGIMLYTGQNLLTVTARDAAMNIGTDTLAITYTPPSGIAVPDLLSAVFNASSGSIDITYRIKAYYVDYFELERSQGINISVRNLPGGIIPGGENVYTFSDFAGLVSGQVYTYRIRAVVNGNTGDYSNSRSVGIRYTFDLDLKADLSVWRPATGEWYTLLSKTSTYTTVQWGQPTDKPLLGDYDGDGKTDRAVWRSSTGYWYYLKSSAPGTYGAVQWGRSTDVPVPCDYDGDGKTDIAVWRPGTGVWYVLPSSAPAGTYTATLWGQSTDIPVPGDYDGDLKTDIAIWRPGTQLWYVLPSSAPGSYTATQWGSSADTPVTGDFDGDGKSDKAIWRSSTGDWYYLKSSVPGDYGRTQWGLPTDIPVPADYDGDRKTDIAVWRPGSGYWFILPSQSPSNPIILQWGLPTDVPIAAVP
jgi:hypothetical protein